jgi:WD40-like Beta Propeller Repeat
MPKCLRTGVDTGTINAFLIHNWGPAVRARSLCTPLLILATIAALGAARAADEPPLIPLTAFFANPQASWEHRVSPDGTRLAWVAMRDGRATLHFRRVEETTARTVETARELRPPWGGSPSFWWSRDGKRLLFLLDRNGDENARVYAVDVEAEEPVARDLTPLDGVRVEFYRALSNEPDIAIVGHNGRTGRLFDLYRLNLATGELTITAENPGDVCGWSVAPIGRVRVRTRCLPDGGWTLEVPDGVGGWREMIRGSYGDHVRLLGFPPGLRYAWALSNRGRDRPRAGADRFAQWRRGADLRASEHRYRRRLRAGIRLAALRLGVAGVPGLALLRRRAAGRSRAVSQTPAHGAAS